jgi:hypothetical protein
MTRAATATIRAKRRTNLARKRSGTREVLSLDQIKSRYNAEWVLVKDPIVDKDMRVLRGEVVCNSKDRSDIHRRAIELGLKHTAFIFTGQIAKDVVIIL